MKKLADDEIQDHLRKVEGWAIKNGALSKEFVFKDFAAAIKFMNQLVPVAEELNHHPDWSNSYNKVSINLVSHDAGGLTEKDFTFAQAADKEANRLQK